MVAEHIGAEKDVRVGEVIHVDRQVKEGRIRAYPSGEVIPFALDDVAESVQRGHLATFLLGASSSGPRALSVWSGKRLYKVKGLAREQLEALRSSLVWKIGRVEGVDRHKKNGRIHDFESEQRVLFHLSDLISNPNSPPGRDRIVIYRLVDSPRSTGSHEAVCVHRLGEAKMDLGFAVKHAIRLEEQDRKRILKNAPPGVFEDGWIDVLCTVSRVSNVRELDKALVQLRKYQLSDDSDARRVAILRHLQRISEASPPAVECQLWLAGWFTDEATDHQFEAWLDLKSQLSPREWLSLLSAVLRSDSPELLLKTFRGWEGPEEVEGLVTFLNRLLLALAIANDLRIGKRQDARTKVRMEIASMVLGGEAKYGEEYYRVIHQVRSLLHVNTIVDVAFHDAYPSLLTDEDIRSLLTSYDADRLEAVALDYLGEMIDALKGTLPPPLSRYMQPQGKWSPDVHRFTWNRVWTIATPDWATLTDALHSGRMEYASDFNLVRVVSDRRTVTAAGIPSVLYNLNGLRSDFREILARAIAGAFATRLSRRTRIESSEERDSACKLIEFILSINREVIEPVLESAGDKSKLYSAAVLALGGDSRIELSELADALTILPKRLQLPFVRRLFALHAEGQLKIDLELLQTLSTGSDEDLEIGESVDLTIDLVCMILRHAEGGGSFPTERVVIEFISASLGSDRTARFTFDALMERCEGRGELVFRSKRDSGKISVAVDGITIEPPTDSDIIYEVQEYLNDDGDPELMYWMDAESYTVDLKHLDIILDFARRNGLFIHLPDQHHKTNNKHLFELERGAIPSHVTYCEGRLAEIPHKFHARKFWWCGNAACFQNCETVHSEEQWREYTLLDFLRILGMNLDEAGRDGSIPNGEYYKLAGALNRILRLRDRLYCASCNEMLAPRASSDYAHYRVVTFYCSNQRCSQYDRDVYLHHCYNPDCGSVIDSRDTSSCPNGWYVCTSCNRCCSEDALRKRRENLEEVRINPPSAPHKKGHNDAGTFYCVRCGSKVMRESDREDVSGGSWVTETFACDNCGYRHSWVSHERRRAN